MVDTVSENIVILHETRQGSWDQRGWEGYPCRHVSALLPVNKALRGVRRLWLSGLGLPFKRIWCNNLGDLIRDASTVIIFINKLNMWMPHEISHINPSTRIIAWWWNIVDNNTLPDDVIGECEKWSFDRGDCEKYGMLENNQFYFSKFVQMSTDVKQQVYYCGAAKDRAENILLAWEQLQSESISSLFQVIGTNGTLLPPSVSSQYVPYDDVCRHIAESEAVVEILRPGQSGDTLRAMESLFFQKKLITDNVSVVDREWYRPENVYVLGEERTGGITAFLAEKFVPYDREVLRKYDVSGWLEGFGLKTPAIGDDSREY